MLAGVLVQGLEQSLVLKFDLCRLNLQIEILNFCKLVKIVLENLVIKSFKLTFGRSKFTD